ncbi:MAG: RsiV family protein [Oscillospiraceae bacterium]
MGERRRAGADRRGDAAVLRGKSRRARRFDRYYRQYARAYLKYCEAELLPRAAETMHTALERSAPWSCARAVLAYRVTLVRGDILSLYTEGREEQLPPRLTLRRAETWDRRTGFLLPLTAFFRRKRRKKRLVRAARETAREQMETGTAAYYPDYGALLRRAFSSRSFYLADDGLHWFYPMYSVAPAAEGIPDFSFPTAKRGRSCRRRRKRIERGGAARRPRRLSP